MRLSEEDLSNFFIFKESILNNPVIVNFIEKISELMIIVNLSY